MIKPIYINEKQERLDQCPACNKHYLSYMIDNYNLGSRIYCLCGARYVIRAKGLERDGNHH